MYNHSGASTVTTQVSDHDSHLLLYACLLVCLQVADIAHAPADPAALGEALAQRAAVAESCKR